MPVKTRKTTRRSKRETHRNRHSARSSSLRSLGITDSTTRENSTISSLKRGIAAAQSAPSRSISLLSSQRRTKPTILRSNPYTSKAQVTVTTDAWYDLLAKNPDLCYLSLSGQFNRKNGCLLKSNEGSFSIEKFISNLYSRTYSPGTVTVEIGNHLDLNRARAEANARAAVDSAIQVGKRFASNPTIDHYSNLFIDDGSAAVMNYGFPYGSSFSEAIFSLLQKNNIDSNMFMSRTNLDYNIYSKIKNSPQYIPERPTCKAILFAVQPTITQALFLFGLAKHSFSDCRDDLILLAFFANQDYDIYKYNQVMKKIGFPTLGSKSRR